MHKIFGLKHVFSTFQETVWSHLNFVFYVPTENKNSETRKKIKLCFACFFIPKSDKPWKLINYIVDICENKRAPFLLVKRQCCQSASTWKLCACTVAQIVQSTVVQWLALITLVWKMDTGVKVWFSVILRRNGKEHWRLIGEWSLDKSLSDVSISGGADVECLLTKTQYLEKRVTNWTRKPI